MLPRLVAVVMPAFVLAPVGRAEAGSCPDVRVPGDAVAEWNVRVTQLARAADGTHVDGLYDAYPDRLRPILPCFRSAFVALEGWTAGHAPPPSATLSRPTSGDLANTCSLGGKR